MGWQGLWRHHLDRSFHDHRIIYESMACHVLVLNTSAWKWRLVLAFMFYGPSKPQGKIWLEIASKSILPYVWNESTQHLWMAIMTNRAYPLSYKYSSPCRRQWHPTPVLLPGKSHGRRSLVGCRLWGRTESDTTEAT